MCPRPLLVPKFSFFLSALVIFPAPTRFKRNGPRDRLSQFLPPSLPPSLHPSLPPSFLPLALDTGHRRCFGHLPRSQQVQAQRAEGMQLAKYFWRGALGRCVRSSSSSSSSSASTNSSRNFLVPLVVVVLVIVLYENEREQQDCSGGGGGSSAECLQINFRLRIFPFWSFGVSVSLFV